jgi:hypothetical protein
MRMLVVLLLCLASGAAQALTFMESEFTCPIGGETFKQRMAASGTQFGVHLDLKPFGPTAAPWPLPVCPGNGFVIFKNDLSTQLKRELSDYVASDEYRAMVKNDTPYYRAAMLMRRAGEDRNAIAWTLLQASWEADADDRWPRYAEAALEAFRTLPEPDTDGKKSDDASPFTRRLLIGELLRRLSRFADADAHFAALEGDTANAAPIVKTIVRYQRELIAARDAGAHQVPETKQDAEESPDPPR